MNSSGQVVGAPITMGSLNWTAEEVLENLVAAVATAGKPHDVAVDDSVTAKNLEAWAAEVCPDKHAPRFAFYPPPSEEEENAIQSGNVRPPGFG
mmetsp:Transcript_20263/g.54553  ORF Transcript_20263/g.54553 Transcript_20263/m.54553 type:complete len:94 (-) Transcript_20263:301-582(-)